MNYYPFHIGDYASATRHLSWEEDLSYRRLLDWCYTNEKPLPSDVAKVCRLMVATTDVQRAAVETVLTEFFVATGDGWCNRRVTGELESMREKQEVTEERDEHEKTRQQKHRERRSAMFAQLSEVGVYPAWNAKTGELERLIQDNCDKPVTQAHHSENNQPVTAPVTPVTGIPSQQGQPATACSNAPATAIPTPTPTPKIKNSPDLLSESEPISNFAIQLVDGTDFKVPERLVFEWSAAYPAVDISQELREMRTWSMANKSKRKTRRGIEAFIVRWLGKAQDTPSRSIMGRSSSDDWTSAAT